ncbi:MAG: UDP-N-acetylmuramoyl-L-alanyl-D-glutamate--2,6-diaminopimelate ligase [Candidatus Eremiobacteraeota bacterium]|nr:UDP-N-acetylmuramoyl-L-alanyl-D-glutamate--2,6-diaminopimelate ligase [Candidatus Eremiobacteraeota bacterium]MBC5820464.1 UDP-N-acetylmuramoyl-L-alanyl-D-glutamate--2,6-diaminopimelate ligase [Candidatus Eremiobacteraeota bacterium]
MTPGSVSLAALIAQLDDARVWGDPGVAVHGLAHDSRAVARGGAFIALRGEQADGHAYLAGAVAAGASAVIVDAAHAGRHEPTPGVTTVVVPDTRRALSRLAATYYAEPSRQLEVVGVTGTNGKTTTTHLIAALLEAGGIVTGRIGTLGARVGGAHWSLDNTTPLALELQALLAEMRARGAAAVAMEVSSHALVLERVADVAFAYGVLTNVTRDHLDFHAGFEAYAAAKRSLFERARTAILNVDDEHGRCWADELTGDGRPVITYGFAAGADVRAGDLVLRADGAMFSCGGLRFALRLPGRFNVHNALAALCVARALGVADATSAAALERFERVPGRMEHIAGAGLDVVVDYAHTPDALEAVLRAARETTRGALIVVFGCGGDRDRGKRPQMGRIASDLADCAIVTSDNPRREEPQAIIEAVLAGVRPGASVSGDVDRRSAIRRAVARARPGDLVVVAGKGHETYQIVGDDVRHFDDRDEVRAALALRARSAASTGAANPALAR